MLRTAPRQLTHLPSTTSRGKLNSYRRGDTLVDAFNEHLIKQRFFIVLPVDAYSRLLFNLSIFYYYLIDFIHFPIKNEDSGVLCEFCPLHLERYKMERHYDHRLKVGDFEVQFLQL